MDKPNAKELGWRLRHTQRPFANRYFQVRQDELILPGGGRQSYSYVEFHPVVVIVPVTVQRDLVLIRQFRYTIDDWVWEVPAGGSHDFDGEHLEDLVRRELHEEIGGRAGEVTWMGEFNPLIGKADVTFNIYLATEVELGPPSPEPGELIEIHRFSIAEALRMAREGAVFSGSSAYALLRCEPKLCRIAAGG